MDLTPINSDWDIRGMKNLKIEKCFKFFSFGVNSFLSFFSPAWLGIISFLKPHNSTIYFMTRFSHKVRFRSSCAYVSVGVCSCARERKREWEKEGVRDCSFFLTHKQLGILSKQFLLIFAKNRPLKNLSLFRHLLPFSFFTEAPLASHSKSSINKKWGMLIIENAQVAQHRC